MDYRVIVRRFEYERLMMPREHETRKRYPGSPFSSEFLSDYYDTTSPLERTFRDLNETQRLLYAVCAVDGQVVNGGISQFFYNCRPILWDAARVALVTLDMEDLLKGFDVLYRRRRNKSILDWIRLNLRGWDSYREFKAAFDTDDDLNEFDTSYYRKWQPLLAENVQRYMKGRDSEVALFVDDDPALKEEWFRKRLERPIAHYDQYVKSNKKSSQYGFFDLLFHPEASHRLGESKEGRRAAAREISDRIFPLIRAAANDTSNAKFVLKPKPCIEIGVGPSGDKGDRRIQISYYEDEIDCPQWGISGWPC